MVVGQGGAAYQLSPPSFVACCFLLFWGSLHFMNRRQFLVSGGVATVAVVAGVSLHRATLPPADIPSLIAELETLRGRALSTREGW